MKLKKALLRESLIAAALLGGGSLLVIIDCLRSRYPVINMGTADLLYVPTVLSETGIIVFLLYPVYLIVRFIIWGIKKGTMKNRGKWVF